MRRQGADRLFGNEGNDRLFGSVGNDVLKGGTGNDVLVGEEGNDALNGQGGFDSCQGSIGTDTATNCEETTACLTIDRNALRRPGWASRAVPVRAIRRMVNLSAEPPSTFRLARSK